MTRHHDKRPARVGEPVQVYLEPRDRKRLERLTEQLGTTKSGVLRRALETLEQQMLDPEQHPALAVIGLGGGGPPRSPVTYDVAREHDRFLAETEPGLRAARSRKQAARRRRAR